MRFRLMFGFMLLIAIIGCTKSENNTGDEAALQVSLEPDGKLLHQAEAAFTMDCIDGTASERDFKLILQARRLQGEPAVHFSFQAVREGKVVLKDEWGMDSNDLDELARTAEMKDSREWLERVFDPDNHYAIKLQCEEITPGEIQDDVLAAPNRRPEEIAELKAALPGMKAVLSYRRSWREDMVIAAYLPQRGEFVAYSRGGY